MTQTSGTLLTRIAPTGLRRVGRAGYVFERNLLVYRRGWMIVFSGFFEPVFYLFAIGIGLGRLVGDVSGPAGTPVPYDAYVAPALLAASAMNGAVFESTFNLFFKLKFGNTYEAMLATPLETRDIAFGELAWIQIRGGLYATGFLVVMLVFGLVDSVWAVLVVPAALLIGFAFGAVGFAATSFMRSWQDFDLVQLVTLPLFLFSATFYPLEVYPVAIQRLTLVSPLYHGVELIRALTLGAFDVSLVAHVGVLVLLGVLGIAVARRRLELLLLK
ncbi:MAG: ABC transporter permease [Nitriliruptorales bacterium]|nr:ABC transporter permease [Nitriliruptorales bacterium]